MHDLVIRNGKIVDGSGAPAFTGDVAIDDGVITSVGAKAGAARREIDASGLVVTPGWVDIHTHYDGQVTWDPYLSPSSWHGVTTIVMGNCGVGFAPVQPGQQEFLIGLMEGVEDIPGSALSEGIKWGWESFPEYMSAIEKMPRVLDVGAQMPHGSLRTYVMGDRAFTDEATSEDLAAMKRELRTAIKAGAAGFSTSRNRNHETPDARPVASRLANWNEVSELVGVMGDLGAGVFELAQEDIERDPDRMRDFMGRLQRLALETRVPTTFGVVSMRKAPHTWRPYFQMIDETVAAGGRMLAQGTSRWISSLLSFETAMPFDKTPVWSDMRKLPLADQEAALRNPESRRALLEAAREYMTKPDRAIGAEARKPNFDYLFLFDKPLPPYRSIAELAKEANKDPLELIIDLALEKHLKQFFIQPIVNEDQDIVLGMMRHPRSVVTFSDSGAHVSQIMDSSIQTHLLGHWVRERQALTLEYAIRKITYELASFWGLQGRGMIREGNFADFAIFDPETISPTMPTLEYDLPAGERRLKQKSVGIKATIVNGQVLMRNNEHSGALPGKLIRGPLAASA